METPRAQASMDFVPAAVLAKFHKGRCTQEVHREMHVA